MTIILDPVVPGGSSSAAVMTSGDIIRSALRKLRVYKPGEAIDAAEVIDNLEVLNAMLDAWSADNLMIYSYTTESFALTAGQSLYTIGSGGNLNTTRPDSIDVRSSFIRDSNSVDTPLESMTEEEYNAIPTKSGTNTLPNRLWYKTEYPLGKLQFDFPPSGGYTLYLVSLKHFTEFPDITTDVSFPAGYREALVYNLAVRLATEYGKRITPELGAIATQSLSKLQHKNAKPITSDFSNVPGGRGRSFNFLTGE